MTDTNNSFIELIDEAIHVFTERQLLDAEKVLRTNNVVDPWEKGNSDEYLIISALISGTITAQVRAKIKKSTKLAVSSKCDCSHWNKEAHCEHIAALLLDYKTRIRARTEKEITDPNGNPQVRQRRFAELSAAYVEEYGTIIDGVHRFLGIPPKNTYSAGHYRLSSGNVIQFPLVNKWQGCIHMNLSQHAYGHAAVGPWPSYRPSFSYQTKEGNIISEVSFFQYLYLFDWKNGDCYDLDNDLKDFIRKILARNNWPTIGEYLQYSLKLRNRKLINISIDGVPLAEFEKKSVLGRILIEPSQRRSYLNLALEFYDENENLITLPDFYRLFCFENGLLSTFKKKNDAYDFIVKLTDFFEEENNYYKHTLRSSSERDYIEDLIEYINTSDNLPYVDTESKIIYEFESFNLKRLLEHFTEYFGTLFFRFATYVPESKKLSFESAKSNILSHIYQLHRDLKLLGIPVFYNRKIIRTWSAQIRFERKKNFTDWFDLDLTVNKEDLEVIKNAEVDQNVVLTSDGLLLLDEEQQLLMKLMKRYTNFESDETKKMEGDLTRFSLPLKRSRIFELFELKKLGIDGALTEDEVELCQKLMTLEKVPEYELPESYKPIARNYQVTGYRWLKFLYESKLGACLADDMGLGKTLQTIMFLESIFQDIKKVLIVCPVSIILNWENEFRKFSNLKVDIYYGGDRTFPHDAKIILTSYGIMKKESFDELQKYDFDIIIMDEVQGLKNVRSLGAGAARNLKANFRICLTGTPVENDLAEFYNIMDLCIPGVWGDLSFIKNRDGQKSRLIAKQTVRPFILRRTKSQVLTDLPEKIENTVYLPFNEDEQSLYRKRLEDIRDKIETVNQQKRYGAILKGLLELRQLCLWQKEKNKLPTKVEFLLENLSQILEEGHQVIVFSQFTTYLDIIQQYIREKRYKFARIDGKQSFKKRQEQVDVFQSGEAPIFLISLRAGGVGLNLTAASYIFMMDPWWNPAVENQAIDRAHRIGQKNKVTVYRPVIKGSVEEKVLLLQERKRELFHDLLGTENDQYFSGKLTLEDFRALLSD